MSRRMSVLPASSASAAGQKDQDLSDTLAKGITEGIDRGPSPSTVVLPMETLLKEAIRTAISKTTTSAASKLLVRTSPPYSIYVLTVLR